MATPEFKVLGRRIRALRSAKELSQQALADLAVLSRESISAIENGRIDPAFSTLIRIANALEVNLAEMLKGF